jgi:predicted transcriptional regulator
MFICDEEIKSFLDEYASNRNRTLSNLVETIVSDWVRNKNGTAKDNTDGKQAYILLAQRAKGRKLTDDEIEFIIANLPEYDYSKTDLQ